MKIIIGKHGKEMHTVSLFSTTLSLNLNYTPKLPYFHWSKSYEMEQQKYGPTVSQRDKISAFLQNGYLHCYNCLHISVLTYLEGWHFPHVRHEFFGKLADNDRGIHKWNEVCLLYGRSYVGLMAFNSQWALGLLPITTELWKKKKKEEVIT